MSTDLTTPAPAQQDRQPVPPLGPSAGRALRLTLGLALIAGGVVLGLWFVGDATAQVIETEQSFADVDRIAFDLRANGSVEVRSHAGDEVLVHERIESTIREVTTSQEVVGGELRLGSQDCSPWFGLLINRCGASYVVTVPSTTSLTGRVSHGSVTLAGLDGTVELRVGHGSIEADRVAGPVTLRTGHGSVTLRQVRGDVEAATGHGTMTVTEVAGTVNLTTSHGGVTATQIAGDASIVTGQGSVTAREVGGQLHARTSHGSIEAVATRGATAQLDTGHGSVVYSPSAAPTSVTITTSHGSVDVALPRDAPAYAITTNADDRAADIAVATDPASNHRMEVRTGQGRIRVGYAGS